MQVRYSDQENYHLSNWDVLSGAFARIYSRLFPGEAVMSMDTFIYREPEELLLALEQSLGVVPEPEVMAQLDRAVTEMVTLAEEVIDHLPADHSHRGRIQLLLSRMMYLRAYVLIHTDQFCEAGMEAREAVETLKKIPVFRDDPAKIYCSARIMFQGLMNAVFVRNYSGSAYTPSDCMSSCGYCQDPLSTLAQEASKSLKDMRRNPESVKRLEMVWGMAAAMLGAYIKKLGGDPLNNDFPEGLPGGVKLAYRLMVRDRKPADYPWKSMIEDYYLVLEH